MEWLDRAYNACLKHHRDTQAAMNGADSVYQNLWSHIIEVVNAANEKGMQLIMNGSPHSHVVAMSVGRERGREVTISLTKDEQLITSESDAESLTFQIGVDDTQVVCLFLDGKTITGEQAAQKIMEGFLFGGRSPFAIPEKLAAQSQAAMQNWGKRLDGDKHLQVPY